ncbi:hypothetical protein PGIGA_G00196010, partial [Pangasianodon gigas]|nr:hypothetical protein [Pangasianodon gigas]
MKPVSAPEKNIKKISGFDVQDFCTDLAYWFKSSTKRKNMLDEFCVFCDTKYMEVLQHLSIRWLSLDLAVNRILRLYNAVKSCFRAFCGATPQVGK